MEGAVVPALWQWEFANGLAMAVRFGRVDRSLVEQQFAEFGSLPVEIDALSTHRAWTTVVSISKNTFSPCTTRRTLS
jgi:hypothetical protein